MTLYLIDPEGAARNKHETKQPLQRRNAQNTCVDRENYNTAANTVHCESFSG